MSFGLNIWKNSPDGLIYKYDVSIAKNYLKEDELKKLNNLTNLFLDYAEDMAEEQKLMAMADWIETTDKLLVFREKKILNNSGRISHKQAKEKKVKQYVEENYLSWNFKEILKFEKDQGESIQFYFQFSVHIDYSICKLFEDSHVFCKDGSIKKLNPSNDDNCYYLYDRTKAIQLKNQLQQKIEESLKTNGFDDIREYPEWVSIDFIRGGKPAHLFTREEIEQEIKKADDRVSNQLIIDENGYVKVTRNEGYGKLYPVRFEQWDAGNRYVGKYADLSLLNDIYLAALDGWLNYLKTGRGQYIDYYYKELNEEELIKEIKKYY